MPTRTARCWRCSNWKPRSGQPVDAENLCHQVVFVEDPASTVTPPDPEMIQISSAVGQGAERRGLVQSSVRPVGVVEVLVLAQHGQQMPLIPYQGPVQ